MAGSVDSTLKKAARHAKRGEAGAARALYQAVLAEFPDNKRARQGLAALGGGAGTEWHGLMALYGQGRLDELAARAEPLTRAHPDEPGFAKLLGAACLGLGRLEAAVAAFAAVAALTPDDPEAHNNLGVARTRAGDFAGAIDSLGRALALRSDYPEARDNLAGAHLGHSDARRDAGDPAGAMDSLAAALELHPGRPELLINLGNLQAETGDAAAAVTSFRAATEAMPGNAEIHNNLGNALIELDDADAALASFRRAVELDPGFAVAHNNLAMAQSNAGDADAALASVREALRLRPDYAEAQFNLSQLTDLDDDDPDLAAMRAGVDAPGLDDTARTYLCFALAKAELALGHVEAGMARLIEGNALRKRALGYDIAGDERLFQAIETYFDGAADPPIAAASAVPRPVFILGMPRSGTTLVEQIVAAHADVHGAGELDALGRAVAASGWDRGTARGDVMAAVRDTYLDDIARRTSAPVITDKMPANFKWIGFIRAALPEARIVHLRRDPAAVCWSNFKTFFTSAGMGQAFDLEDIARYHKLHDRLMASWHDRFPGAVFELDYERLTENPEAEARRLLGHLDLPWDDAVLDFHRARRVVRTASQMQVRREIYTGSSEEWRAYADRLKPMLDILDA